MTFGKSQTTRRFEDVRFLTGHGRYIDDTAPKGALVAFFLRSQVAHAEFRLSGRKAARAMPGAQTARH